MVSYRIVSVYHVNTQYRIESPLPGIAHLYNYVSVLVQSTSRHKLGAHQRMQGACKAHTGRMWPHGIG